LFGEWFNLLLVYKHHGYFWSLAPINKLKKGFEDEAISIQQFLLAPDLDSLFDLPLTPEAFDEMLQLQDMLQMMQFDSNESDSRSFIWGNQRYSSRCYYERVFANFSCSPVFKALWKTICTNRIKCFLLLVLVDRINTRGMLLQRNYNVQPNALCVLCSANIEEDIDHLFISCSFASTCWIKLDFHWVMNLPVCDRLLQAASCSMGEFFLDFFCSSGLGDLEHTKQSHLRQWCGYSKLVG
jgi:hypothetical protein